MTPQKIRTVKGPLGGRSFKTTRAGMTEIVLTGPKRETREQKWERLRSQPYYLAGHSPMVKATYQIAMRHINIGNGVVYAPCMHPDGSFFYEYVEGSITEY